MKPVTGNFTGYRLTGNRLTTLVRGCPKGNWSLNRVFRGAGKGKRKATETNNQQQQSSSFDNCAECGHTDPPSKARKNNKADIQWVQCDTCDYWYHISCTTLTVKPRANKGYVCIRCN